MQIEVWSDVACPWCYIGKRRLAEGIRQHVAAGGDPVEVEYRSFELAPDLPQDATEPLIEYMSVRKGIPEAQVRAMFTQVSELARAEGIDAHFETVQQTRTLKAHELLHLAKAHGVQEPMKERLLSAYFVEGGHVGRTDDLVTLAVQVGLDADEVRAALAAGTYAAAVQADIEQARAHGIGGVPFFVIDHRYGISGAQSAETFAGALAHAAEDRATTA